MLFTNSVDPKIQELSKELLSIESLKEFYLVGGTSLSLQIGHRISVDIDLFSEKDFKTAPIIEEISQKFALKLIRKKDFNSITASIYGIKIDIVAHKYKTIKPILKENGLRLISIADISAMKLSAIADNGTRSKDFVDIYFLLKLFSIKELLEFFHLKYGMDEMIHILMSLNFFDDVTLEDWPVLLKEKDLSWEDVKNDIDMKVNEYYKVFLNEKNNYQNEN